MQMKTRQTALCAAIMTIAILTGTGCKSIKLKTTHQKVVTGLYGNQLDVLATNFSRIKERETTQAQLEELGFKLENVPNMKVLEGVPAFEELFGKEGFRNIDLMKSVELLHELGLFTLYQIPYKDVTTVTDRVYMNRQRITVQGPDMMFIIIVRDGLVVYRKKNLIVNNTVEFRKRFLGGPIDLINEIAGPIKAVR